MVNVDLRSLCVISAPPLAYLWCPAEAKCGMGDGDVDYFEQGFRVTGVVTSQF